MKTLRKIRKNAKALSPVVASIILIAVTVAVSIAVAAWMGALTFQFTAVEELQLPPSSEVTFTNTTITLTVKNTGTSPVTIAAVRVNGETASATYTPAGETIEAASEKTVEISDLTITAGTKYRVEFVTSSNKQFFQDYTATSPLE